MKACYDLARCPPTYDVVAFLARLEEERLARGAEEVDLCIAPGPRDGYRADHLWPHTTEERDRMRDGVLVPLCRLLPAVRTVTVGGPVWRDAWGWDAYHVGLPTILRALRAGMRPLRATETPAIPSPYVTMTLREADHYPARNSRVGEWLDAARQLAAWYPIIIVRDTARADEPIRVPWAQMPIATSRRAAVNLGHRAMLYARAALNVGISNGPMWMSIFMNAPTCMLRPTTNAAGGCYDDAFFRRHGLAPGAQLPTSPTHQRLVWADDTADNIVGAVREMLHV